MAGDPTALELCDEVSAWLASIEWRKPRIASHKHVVAGALLSGAVQHFEAIRVLAHIKSYPSALALLRVEWEAVVRAAWMWFVCREQNVAIYYCGDLELPSLTKAVGQIEKALPPSFRKGAFRSVQNQVGAALDDLTHMGAPQIRNLAFPDSEAHPSFPPHVVESGLAIAFNVAFYAAALHALLADDEDFGDEVTKCYRDINLRLRRLGAYSIEEATLAMQAQTVRKNTF